MDDADPWMVILAAADFTVQSMYHQIKQKSMGQLIFGERRDTPNQSYSQLETNISEK